MKLLLKLIYRILIPKGYYCYSNKKCNVCPFFTWIDYIDDFGDEIREGACSYLKKQGGMCLDDQVKECEFN